MFAAFVLAMICLVLVVMQFPTPLVNSTHAAFVEVCNFFEHEVFTTDSIFIFIFIFSRYGDQTGDGSACAESKGCAGVVCSGISSISCQPPMVVSSIGFRGCCFDPLVDCVPTSK
jgi:hypothetical protein